MIPKVIHFIFGLSEDFGGIPFSLYHFIAAASAKNLNKDFEVVIHYHHEPKNEWWDRCKSIVRMDKISEVPTSYKHVAHRTDRVRLDILIADGGIYLDMDTLCIKPFEPFLDKRCVMGIEMDRGEITGLCNGVIMAEPDYVFLRMWKEALTVSDPPFWNKNACMTPLHLYYKNPSRIHLEPPESFFRLTWSEEGMRAMHEDLIVFQRSYSAHLYETASYKKYLSKITMEDIQNGRTTFTSLARQALA